MTAKALFGADDLAAIESKLGRPFELMGGELYEAAHTVRQSETVVSVGSLLMGWNERVRAGTLSTHVGFLFQQFPGTVLALDVAFFRKGRLAGVDTRHGFLEIVPDLAIEVRSPNDTWAEPRRKAEQFMARGTELVLIVEPDRVAEVLRAGQPPRRLHLEDVFEAPEILPGFSCRVSDFFPEEL